MAEADAETETAAAAGVAGRIRRRFAGRGFVRAEFAGRDWGFVAGRGLGFERGWGIVVVVVGVGRGLGLGFGRGRTGFAEEWRRGRRRTLLEEVRGF